MDQVRSSYSSSEHERAKESVQETAEFAICNLYEVETSNGIKTILEVPNEIPNFSAAENASDHYNLVMIDVSGSMSGDWSEIECYWNSSVAPSLFGLTKIFVFGSEIVFRRTGTKLEEDDFLCSSTNLTGAIEKIRLEIEASTHSFIRVFLITDGGHNATSIEPDVEIQKLHIPEGKIVEVFLLGLRQSFPVEYSITIRSMLHNGNSNVPSLFWAKEEFEIENEMENMAEIIRRGFIDINLSENGYLCPEMKGTTKVHLTEYVYFHSHPADIEKKLKLSRIGETSEEILIHCKFIKMDATVNLMLDKVFLQWNSIIIQQHKRKQSIPENVFEIMKDIYERMHAKLKLNLESTSISIKTRLLRKELKRLEIEFATLMNQSKTIIGLETQFNTEIELAEIILKTTVKSKYDMKNLRMKGHMIEDYQTDMKEFIQIFNRHKEAIMSLKDPEPEECCNILFQSPILDLKDAAFQDLVKEDKYSFMKTFTLTGIPIYAPVKDSSQINPWALCIKNILISPFNIVSQCTLELSADVGHGSMDEENKAIMLREGDKNTLCNAIIPVFDTEVANILKPLIRTNIFGMLCTFCILKNPHIIDMNIHFAALACVFIKTVSDFPAEKYPAYINDRLQMIEATAKVYLDRKGFKKYVEIMTSSPNEALMTECKKDFDGFTIKCETLIKPIFFLYLLRDDSIIQQKLEEIFRSLVLEFIGRNLSKYNVLTPYTDLFVPELSSMEKRKIWLEMQLKNECVQLSKCFNENKGPLLSEYFMLEDVLKQAKRFAVIEFDKKCTSFYTIKPCIEKVEKFYNPASTGNINFKQLKILAVKLGLTPSVIDDVFSERNIFIYLHHGLQFKSSSERLSNNVKSYEEAYKLVEKKVERENHRQLKKYFIQQFLEEIENIWTKEYLVAHYEIIKPMTAEEIVATASDIGFDVTLESFHSKYRYNLKSHLLRNACMCTKCPHYLIPNRSFNQHISVERRKTTIAHQMHMKSVEVAAENNGNAEMILKRLLEQDLIATCGRKNNPPSPDGDALRSLKPQLGRLLKQYEALISTQIDVES